MGHGRVGTGERKGTHTTEKKHRVFSAFPFRVSHSGESASEAATSEIGMELKKHLSGFRNSYSCTCMYAVPDLASEIGSFL